jgi:hypothetical protein
MEISASRSKTKVNGRLVRVQVRLYGMRNKLANREMFDAAKCE